MDKFLKFLKNEGGVTSIEYSIIAGVIAIGIVTALVAIGTKLSVPFETVSDKLPSTIPP